MKYLIAFCFLVSVVGCNEHPTVKLQSANSIESGIYIVRGLGESGDSLITSLPYDRAKDSVEIIRNYLAHKKGRRKKPTCDPIKPGMIDTLLGTIELLQTPIEFDTLPIQGGRKIKPNEGKYKDRGLISIENGESVPGGVFHAGAPGDVRIDSIKNNKIKTTHDQ